MATQPSEMGDAMNASLDIQTQVEILQSDTLALKVIRDLDLEKTRDFKPRWSPIGAVLGLFASKGIPDPVSASLEDAPGRRGYATRVFSNHLKVRPIAGSRLIEVNFTSSDPKLAAAVVNDLTRVLMDYAFNRRNSATNQTSHWLGNQVADLKKQAHDLQVKVVELQRYTGIYSLGEDSQGRDQVYSATLDQLQQATTALSSATSSRIMKGALYDTIRQGDPEMISTLAGAGIGSGSSVQSSLALLQNLRTQQATAAAQLAQDTSKFGSDYPKLADERSNVASLDRAVNEEIHRIGERARNDYEAAQQTEDKLQAVYAQRKGQAEKLNDRAIEYGIAKQEADNSRSLYEDLSKRLSEAGIIEGLRSSNISVVSPGRVAAKPSSPDPPLYLAGAIALGLFLGACGALYSDMTDPTIGSFGVVEQSLGVVFLAVLPSLVSKSLTDLLPSPVAKLLSRGPARPAGSLLVLNEPTSPFAEALRRMRASLIRVDGARRSQVILVTSSVPKEGKTTVAINLAAVLAQSGKNVLFVEADMRKPNSGELINLAPGFAPGLSDLLSDSKEVLLAKHVPALPQLQLLAPGPVTSFSTDLLSASRMRDLLEQWKSTYDYIVVDSASLLDFADALILSELADITILLARYGFTANKSLERSYQMLASNSDANICVVLNAADRNSVNYHEYYGYSGSTSYQTS
jgi:succinoglycan biosynthesis transport protein ExoP